jgi:hypothetical protein
MENVSEHTITLEKNIVEAVEKTIPESPTSDQTIDPKAENPSKVSTGGQDIEEQKLQIERDKLRLEKVKAWISAIAIAVPIITALLTIMTGLLTFLFTNKINKENATRQQELNIKMEELKREHTFADLINKDRLTKIAEVWAQADKYEAAVELVTKDVDTSQPGVIRLPSPIQPEDIEQGKTLYGKVSESLATNKFWLGDDLYNEIKHYVDSTYKYFLAKSKGEATESLKRARIDSRNSLNQLREKLLKGLL